MRFLGSKDKIVSFCLGTTKYDRYTFLLIKLVKLLFVDGTCNISPGENICMPTDVGPLIQWPCPHYIWRWFLTVLINFTVKRVISAWM